MSALSEYFNTTYGYNNSAYDEYQNISDDEYYSRLLELIRKTHDKPLTTGQLVHHIVIILCYSLIILVSLCGNLLVVKVIAFGKRKMLTTTNILIASLAFSDIVMTAFNIPFNVARLLLESWPFGAFLCVSVPFVQVTCVYVSTFTMTVIAFHRWWTLRRADVSRSLTKFQLLVTIGSTWLLAATLAIPHSVFNKTIVIPTIKNMVRCEVDYPDIDFRFPLWLSVEAFTTQYFVPLSITIWLYIKIGVIINKQGMIAGQSTDERKRLQSEARKRRIVMLILVVTVFAICWLPLNLYHLLVDFELISRHYNIFLVCHWFAMSSVCYNPFIYCYLNNSFKNGAKKFYHFILCRKPSPDSTVVNDNGTQRQLRRQNTDAVANTGDESPSTRIRDDCKTKVTNVDTTKSLD
ncbi:unnamed protein product [Oppiella nova]|uniref:Neuropeptide Y receptor type 1 n=1 Tax=Oppiella nova TaxID=334625 RepID=A0A7R9LGF0_9ACAR|nr:unnamed protein product [Oppiella nova]CAG2163302.1 unnamed protein product [Oppiella nova]